MYQLLELASVDELQGGGKQLASVEELLKASKQEGALSCRFANDRAYLCIL